MHSDAQDNEEGDGALHFCFFELLRSVRFELPLPCVDALLRPLRCLGCLFARCSDECSVASLRKSSKSASSSELERPLLAGADDDDALKGCGIGNEKANGLKLFGG